MNDECGDKLSDNRSSIDNSREWLSNDGGVVERVHKLSAAHVSLFLLNKKTYYLFYHL